MIKVAYMAKQKPSTAEINFAKEKGYELVYIGMHSPYDISSDSLKELTEEYNFVCVNDPLFSLRLYTECHCNILFFRYPNRRFKKSKENGGPIDIVVYN